MLVLAVTLVAAVLVVAGLVAYVVTRPPPPINLRVTDGSIVGVIEGNLTSSGSLNALVLDFATTTFANESGNVSSTLKLHLWTETYYDAASGDLQIEGRLNASGRFAPSLRPNGLLVTLNQTGPLGIVESWAPQSGVNVSFDPNQYITFADNGSGSESATLINRTGATYYQFWYSDGFWVTARPWFNRFLGFRATATGLFAVAIQVSVLLEVVNVNGGT